jgi:hypothetical protein
MLPMGCCGYSPPLQFTAVRYLVCCDLGLSGGESNRFVFPVVARALGLIWNGRRAHGRDLVIRYAHEHQLATAGEHAHTFKAAGPLTSQAVRSTSTFLASPAFLDSYEWRKLRMVVLKKRGRRCACCGASPDDGRTVVNVDHIKPRRLYPELALDESNLQVLCAQCNHGKGNWDQTDWRVSTPQDQAHTVMYSIVDGK